MVLINTETAITAYYYQIVKYKSGNVIHKYTVTEFEFIEDAKALYNYSTGYRPCPESQFRYVAIDYYSTTKTHGDTIRAHWDKNILQESTDKQLKNGWITCGNVYINSQTAQEQFQVLVYKPIKQCY